MKRLRQQAELLFILCVNNITGGDSWVGVCPFFVVFLLNILWALTLQDDVIFCFVNMNEKWPQYRPLWVWWYCGLSRCRKQGSPSKLKTVNAPKRYRNKPRSLRDCLYMKIQSRRVTVAVGAVFLNHFSWKAAFVSAFIEAFEILFSGGRWERFSRKTKGRSFDHHICLACPVSKCPSARHGPFCVLTNARWMKSSAKCLKCRITTEVKLHKNTKNCGTRTVTHPWQ